MTCPGASLPVARAGWEAVRLEMKRNDARHPRRDDARHRSERQAGALRRLGVSFGRGAEGARPRAVLCRDLTLPPEETIACCPMAPARHRRHDVTIPGMRMASPGKAAPGLSAPLRAELIGKRLLGTLLKSRGRELRKPWEEHHSLPSHTITFPLLQRQDKHFFVYLGIRSRWT